MHDARPSVVSTARNQTVTKDIWKIITIKVAAHDLFSVQLLVSLCHEELAGTFGVPRPHMCSIETHGKAHLFEK